MQANSRIALARIGLGVLLSFTAGMAERAYAGTYSCSVSGSMTVTYSNTVGQCSPITITAICTGSGGSPLSLSTSVAPANNGLHASGAHNRAQFGAGFVNYDLYSDSGCTTLWTSTPTASNWNASGSTQTITVYGGVPTQGAPAQGTYADTVQINLTKTGGGASLVPSPTLGALSVSIGVNPVCTISGLGNINFGSYTSFGPTKFASTSFGVSCTNAWPYSLDIGATTAVMSGTNLQYSLLLNTTNANGSGSNPLTGLSGTGSTQTFFINGTLPQQAGGCSGASCSGSDSRTLTITY